MEGPHAGVERRCRHKENLQHPAAIDPTAKAKISCIQLYVDAIIIVCFMDLFSDAAI